MFGRRLTVLVVENSLVELQKYVGFVKSLGHEAIGVSTPCDAFKFLENLDSKKTCDVLLTDMHIGDEDKADEPGGLSLLRAAREYHAQIVPIAMTSDPKVLLHEKVEEAGALQFLRKPIMGSDDIAIAIQGAWERKTYHDELKRFKETTSLPQDLLRKYPEGVVIDKKDRKLIECLAKNRKLSLCLMGETGTGKEEYAKLLHRYRAAREGHLPFVAVNCASLTSDIAASLLFGHKKGSFTGASETTNGFVGDASGGILFLDEIHCLDRNCQQKLLRVLNDGTYNRLGESKQLHAQFQLVTASTRDLDDEVENGNFMQDLRTRIIGFEMILKPLRARSHEELEALVALFFVRSRVGISTDEFKKLVERCASFHWRGNIRELLKTLDVLVLQAELFERPVQAEHLQVTRSMLPPGASDAGVRSGDTKSLFDNLRLALTSDMPLDYAVEATEKAVLTAAIARHKTLGEVCAALSISRSAMDVKRRRYGIN